MRKTIQFKTGTITLSVHVHTQQYSFYKNAQGQIPFPSSIHPGPRNRATKLRKKQNSIANHQARRAANQVRNQNKNNSNWHGIGRHAGVKPGF